MRKRRRPEPDIAIARQENESNAIKECLTLLEAEKLIGKDDVVVITPNWVQKQKAESGIVVGPESLRTIIQFVKERYPKRIVVATGSGQKDTAEIMRYAGFEQIIREEAIEFVDLNYGPFTRIPLNHDKPNATDINKLINDMTFLISFSQLKIHEEATMSAAIKNIALGWPPAKEHGFPKKNTGIHQNLHGFITAMAEVLPIDLSIVSASPAMVGTGPGKGIPYHTGLVIAGTDPVAVDTVGARFLGLKTQGVQYLYDCANRQIGIGDTNQMQIKGIPLVEAEKAFTDAVYGQFAAVDLK